VAARKNDDEIGRLKAGAFRAAETKVLSHSWGSFCDLVHMHYFMFTAFFELHLFIW
jgi:hypothetical protein